MKRIFGMAILAAMLLALVIGCKSDGQNGETEVPKLPATDIEQITPQFTGADRATFVHPIRNSDNKIITMETNFGKMIAERYHDLSPAHADSFVARTADGFYENISFHRVVAGFMIQGGGFSTDGSRKPVSYTIPAEFNDNKHYEGTLSMARTPDPNSASTQFFVCLGRNRSTASLDKQYTVFGQLLQGYDVLEKIGAVECEITRGTEKSSPVEPVTLIKAYISDKDGNPIK